MALDIFLKLDTVVGESADKIHRKEIDVLFWSWGMLFLTFCRLPGWQNRFKAVLAPVDNDFTQQQMTDPDYVSVSWGDCLNAPQVNHFMVRSHGRSVTMAHIIQE